MQTGEMANSDIPIDKKKFNVLVLWPKILKYNVAGRYQVIPLYQYGNKIFNVTALI